MIDRGEIDLKAAEFEIHTSDVQRDYVFGWLLFSIFNHEYLSKLLVLKGGNCFRKAYFPNTRFSRDLDFSINAALDIDQFIQALGECCAMAQDASGVRFIAERNSFEEARRANQGQNTDRKIYKGKVFFQDFYGAQSSLEISVRMDVTEFDRLYMPTSQVPLIHPYSDSKQCSTNLTCVAVEECIASKMKCLLQRRHTHDLYDLVYASFFNNEIELDRREIARVFLRKTIFSDSPGSARRILLGLPFAFFRAAWEKYIVCPIQSRLDFDRAQGVYAQFIDAIFDTDGLSQRISDAYFPAELRNLFLEAGSGQRLMQIRYDGIERVVEPYALTYKRRSDSIAREYLYVWDRTGGSSGVPGIRSLVNPKVLEPTILDETFEPQFEIELSKSGEDTGSGYFGGSRGRTRARRVSRRRSGRAAYAGGPKQIVKCSYCGKRFKRKTSSTRINPHKNKQGYDCPGRYGHLVGWQY